LLIELNGMKHLYLYVADVTLCSLVGKTKRKEEYEKVWSPRMFMFGDIGVCLAFYLQENDFDEESSTIKARFFMFQHNWVASSS